MAQIVLLDPTADAPPSTAQLAPRIKSLFGRNVGFRVQWSNFDVFVKHVEALMRERYQIADTARWNFIREEHAVGIGYASDELQAKRRATIERFTGQVDVAILGLAA
ncbi:MAG: hypothetical protein HY329_16050 [Chloroflexi bacterium]|nr:hypothetical protein [Chloroflexota bacterium]